MSAEADEIAGEILARLNGRLAWSNHTAYDLDQVPANATDYVEITLSRRFAGNVRAGVLSPSSWRLTARSVGQYVANARLLHSLVKEELENTVVIVGADESTPVTFEGEEPVGPTDAQRKYWTGMRSYTFAF